MSQFQCYCNLADDRLRIIWLFANLVCLFKYLLTIVLATKIRSNRCYNLIEKTNILLSQGQFIFGKYIHGSNRTMNVSQAANRYLQSCDYTSYYATIFMYFFFVSNGLYRISIVISMFYKNKILLPLGIISLMIVGIYENKKKLA